jgi:hypothetical protein
MGEQIIRDKSSFGIMTKIDFNKFPKILEAAIRTIFPIVRNFQPLPLDLISNLVTYLLLPYDLIVTYVT